ncbi:hypothetical protein K435DRAFT_837116 [Dendrothele bispora CBS 962.96]|uniref:Uncharacterized protein n=1 Tax=Dendrothele bispora (strain CBS 962.96) TaxID=1314807 RepID=A0A4S8MEM7_DENBC|nr:hypothetical protein K435DRAFT_837116 [Dendrothele bispora CBS 962.96]
MFTRRLELIVAFFHVCLRAQALAPRQMNGGTPTNGTNSFDNITLNQLSSILTNSSCDPTFVDECRNASQALPFLNQGFTEYNISSVGEKAALLSLMVFESGGFKYDKNHFPPPGNPGQGTRNMMNFPFVCQYARSLPSTSSSPFLQSTDPTIDICSSTSVDDSTKNNILSLVLSDDTSFASAAWFYTKSGPDGTGCTAVDGMVEGLQNQSEEGWENFITGCLFTTVTDDRKAVWSITLEVLGTPDSSGSGTTTKNGSDSSSWSGSANGAQETGQIAQGDTNVASMPNISFIQLYLCHYHWNRGKKVLSPNLPAAYFQMPNKYLPIIDFRSDHSRPGSTNGSDRQSPVYDPVVLNPE